MSDETKNNGLITPQKTPKNKFKAPNNDRPKPIFSAEPTSFSTKKVSQQKSSVKGEMSMSAYPEIYSTIILFLNQ